jgi:hypothetical protein
MGVLLSILAVFMILLAIGAAGDLHHAIRRHSSPAAQHRTPAASVQAKIDTAP